MAKRRGNPNWGKFNYETPLPPTVTEFEQTVKKFNLQPDQYVRSVHLREWAVRNKNTKYVPESLLKAWGVEIDSTLDFAGD
jgi:hypothetical protein